MTEIAADDAGPVRRITDDLHPYGTDPAEAELPVRRLGLPDRSTADLDLIAAARDERTLQHDGSRVLAQAVAGAQLRVNNGVERIDRDRSLLPRCRRSSPAASRSGTPTIASSRQDTNCSRRSCRLVSARRRDS